MVHQARRGWRGRPRRDRRWPLLVVALVVLLVLALVTVVVVLAQRASARPTPTGADARTATVSATGPPAGAYPWSLPSSGSGGEVDPKGFLRGSCASYAAWWLNAHGVPFARTTRGPAGVATFGDAGGWDAAARAAGFAVGSVPHVGSLAQWHAGESSPPGGPHEATLLAGTRGHVAVVLQVFADGSVLVVGMDGDTHRLERVRTRAPRYLAIGLVREPVRDVAPALTG